MPINYIFESYIRITFAVISSQIDKNTILTRNFKSSDFFSLSNKMYINLSDR